jgi:mRNA interferase MazF
LKRGEIWTLSGGADYAGKPRPAVIVQSDKFGKTNSITVCPLTRTELPLHLTRLPLSPSKQNGLLAPSYVMVDKASTVPKDKLGYRIGRLDDGDIAQLDRNLIIFLNLAG